MEILTHINLTYSSLSKIFFILYNDLKKYNIYSQYIKTSDMYFVTQKDLHNLDW